MNKQMLGVLIVIAILVIGFAFYRFKGVGESVDEMVVDVETIEEISLVDGDYQIDLALSMVNWEGKKTLIANYIDEGTISIKEGDLQVSGGKISSGDFVIDMNTIKAGSTSNTKATVDMLEKHLKSDDFFGVEKFPTAKFTIKDVNMIGGEYIASGELTIKDITNQIEFPITINQEGEGSVTVVGGAVLDRTKWDIRYGSDKFFDNLANNVIDDNFTVKFDIKFKNISPKSEIEDQTATTTASTTVSQ